MLASFEGAAGILIMSAVRVLMTTKSNPSGPIGSSKLRTIQASGILLQESSLLLRNGSQFKMGVGGDEGSMENMSRHSVSG